MAIGVSTTPAPNNLSYPAAVQLPFEAYSTDGAINLIGGGIAVITKASAAAMTLAAPSADGVVLHIVSKTAAAHTVTVTGGAGGSGQDVGTFGGAINDGCTLVSYGSQWYVSSTRNCTFA